ncbi:MAG: hypothetical protein LBH25_10660 [Fibromonadaceae bacterium]|jgi:hypothetical protein|nr:hypothetical protein [Fibromonadaceae bacterium]
MVRNFVIRMSTMLFVFSFLACSNKPPSPKNEKGGLISVDSKWAELPKGEPFPWNDADGFYPHKDNPYGFDRHTKPRAGNKEDSIVYASVASRSISVKFYKDEVKVTTNEDGLANLKINKIVGLPSEYEYYICNPAFRDTVVKNIDNSKSEQTYKFTNDMENELKKVALCRKDKNGGIAIMQELHIHTYDWKGYSFLPIYYNGGANDEKNALVMSYEFWDGFSEVYKQAMVYPSIGNFVPLKGTVINARVRGTYPDICSKGDIENIRRDIHEKIEEDKSLPRRIIFQLGLPTKRFWPLKEGADGNIEICGVPEEVPIKDKDYDMVGMVKSGKDCNVPDADIRWSSGDNKLYLKSKFGGELILATDSLFKELKLEPECLGMAEVFPNSLGQQYVEELRSTALATTMMDRGKNFAFVILPWRGEDTKRIAHHELGHTMGLGDVRTDLPGTGDDNPKSEQGNIMFYKTQTGYKLRQRSMPIKNREDTLGIFPPIGNENQWNCLQRKSNSCVYEDWHF